VPWRCGTPRAAWDAARPWGRKPQSTRFGEAASGRAGEPAVGAWGAYGGRPDGRRKVLTMPRIARGSPARPLPPPLGPPLGPTDRQRNLFGLLSTLLGTSRTSGVM
jgi:hypothetical protein